jgi:3-deoxy-D-manno-octulosonic-acid transferase
LISGIFRVDHYFFKWYGAWGRKQLNCFTHFFVQNAESALLLESIGYKNASITGDTRFDRVFDICKNAKQYNLIDIFKGDRKILIAGSTWLNDEQLLSTLNITTLNIKLIIAPHEINEVHILSLETLFSKNQNIDLLRFSKANEHNIKYANVLIIDSIGLLSSLYQYGTIAYIGGGFGKGIHNILEAATFGLPVIFGPHYKKFAEAVELINQQGAFSINDANSLNKQLTFLLNDNNYSAASSICKKYVEANTGATDRILTKISMVTV